MRHGAYLALAALVCYVLLRQGSGHGDGPGILLLVRHGALWTAENHYLYVPVLALTADLLAPLGIDAFTAGGLLSAFASAVGVWFVHAACRRLSMTAWDAALVTVLSGFAPAVVYFATTVEMHGLFFGFAGFAMWRAAVAMHAPTIRAAAGLGVATGLAFGAHATAHLLVPLLLALFWAETRSWRATGRTAVIAIATHVAVVALGVWFVRQLGSQVSVGQGAGFLRLFAAWAVEHPDLIFGKLLEEWLWPFLLPSIAWLAGIRAAPRLAFVTGVSLLVYFAIAFSLAARAVEHGAYLLPLAWPAAWLVVRGLPRSASAVVAALTVGYAFAFVLVIDDPRPHREYSAGLTALSGDEPPFLLIGSPLDFEACAISLPEVEYYTILDLTPHPLELAVPAFDQLVAKLEGERKRVFLTSGAREVLEQAASELGSPTARGLLEHIDEAHDPVSVERDGFRGWQLTR